MKKLMLSAAVIFGFMLYSAYEKNNAVYSNNASGSSAPYISPKNGTSPVSGGNSQGSSQANGQYKDGTYTGAVADAFYGNVQVKAIIQGGRINDVQFLQYPNDRGTSIMINSQATPILASEAIQAQTANVDVVSGATDTSNAFIQSLTSALSQAQ